MPEVLASDIEPEEDDRSGLERIRDNARVVIESVEVAAVGDSQLPLRVVIGLGLIAGATLYTATQLLIPAIVSFVGLWLVMVYVFTRRR